MIVTHGGSKVAIRINHWLSDADVIVKPLGEMLHDVRIVNGGCVLDTGRVALVLNPAEMLERALGRTTSKQVQTPTTSIIAEKSRILLVEDSAITRGMLARIIRAMGYEVLEASNGKEALSLLDQQNVQLLVTDIDMPEMDGFTLAEEVRREESLKNIPIIVLSTRGEDEDKLKAIQAGADAYLTKMDFSEAYLRNIIRRQLGD